MHWEGSKFAWKRTHILYLHHLTRLHTQDWTIIRPGGLKSGQPSGRAILTEDCKASGLVDRADVADMIIRVLGTDKLCTRKEFTVVDPLYSPGYDYQPFVL